MNDTVRLLSTGFLPGATNMGLDHAVLDAVAEGRSGPTVRLYGWKPAAVTIGYFQSMREEVDVESCARAGVDRIRRLTGGGAVFHDDEITYSIVVPETHPLARGDVLATYRAVCDLVIGSIAKLGVESSFAPINDIVAGGKKVSGNAQTRRKGCLLQHGTILLSVDVERMFSLLLVPQEKLKGKLIEDVKARVTGLSELLGRKVAYDEALGALSAGFAEGLAAAGFRLAPDEPRADELEAAARHARETYSSEAWNFRR